MGTLILVLFILTIFLAAIVIGNWLLDTAWERRWKRLRKEAEKEWGKGFAPGKGPTDIWSDHSR